MKIKTLLLGAAITTMAAVGYSQGTVSFGTFQFAPATNTVLGARVPTGAGYLAQLYYGGATATEAQLISVTNAPANFAPVAGFISAGTRYTQAGVLGGGAPGTFQIRAWTAALGSSYEAALVEYHNPSSPLYGTAVLGNSQLFNVTTGNPNGSPPTSPALIPNTLPGWNLVPVPEPSVIALGALGLAAVLWRRRK